MDNKPQPTEWPDLAVGLFDRLTGRNAEITYELSNFEVRVPSRTGEKADYATWKFDGALKIRARDGVDA
jgi:hypothetical protein